jgi:DNA polymerase III sliding clamp (beta) subunit (PCNA family)
VELSASSEYPDEAAFERVPIADWQGEPLDIAFNLNYLLDFFRVVETDRVWISMKDGKSPASFATEQPDVCYIVYQCIVMPMRLDIAAPQNNGNNGVE